jgi:hypothetical protein
MQELAPPISELTRADLSLEQLAGSDYRVVCCGGYLSIARAVTQGAIESNHGSFPTLLPRATRALPSLLCG